MHSPERSDIAGLHFPLQTNDDLALYKNDSQAILPSGTTGSGAPRQDAN
ncbi:hypothetical protein J9978_15935 [Chromobacterium violaceum]|nr:hypothetical protein [Chromobacterium violaceum]MBP4050977.1 hypothetical protein [Chromobacterium violaceum]